MRQRWFFSPLANCKPEIRKIAKLYDFLIGIGGRNLGLGRLIYVAKITEIFCKTMHFSLCPWSTMISHTQ